MEKEKVEQREQLEFMFSCDIKLSQAQQLNCAVANNRILILIPGSD